MEATYRITGTRALLMHNSQLVDPLNPHTKAIAAISKKRQKTEDDNAALGRAEYVGGLYLDPDGGGPCIPGENIERCIRDGATRRKRGRDIQRGLIVLDEHVPLEYDGPRDPEALSRNERFTLRRPAKVGQSSVIRTRPKFPEWSATFTVDIADDILDIAVVDQALDDAGRYLGLGDWRPRYGRFTWERVA